jgi:AhpC/TSA family protein
MKRRPNWLVWAGLAVAVLAAMSYIPVFARFPLTRDVPWANLLLFLAAGWLLGKGLYRAFARDGEYGGKVSGPVLTALSLALFALFVYGAFVGARQLPPPGNALHAGQQAPDFTLTRADGSRVTLSQLREGKRAVLLIFYRGYW